MLLSVKEAAMVLELKPSQLYYRLNLYQIDGAIKICRNWRIDEETVRKLYERVNAKRAGILPGFTELVGLDAVLANIRETSLQTDKKSCFARIPGRKGMEHCKSRLNCLAGIGSREVTKQLNLFET